MWPGCPAARSPGSFRSGRRGLVEAPIVLALAAGVVSFLSPCIVPMISVYLTLITGMTMDELTARPGLVIRRTIVVNTLLFALGFTIVFTLAGGAAGAIGAARSPRRLLRRA